jgi:SAM-dependent methyltransferase
LNRKAICFLHGKQIAKLSSVELHEYHETVFDFNRGSGFPYPRLSIQQIGSAFDSFANSKQLVIDRNHQINWSPLGLALANHFQPHMWRTKCERFRTPAEVFQSDQMFFDSIERASKYWTDRRPHVPHSIRSMLCTYVNTKRVSNFRPTAARALYERFSKPGDLIVDPSAGYGGRLLGALPLDRTYFGIEPHPDTFNGLRNLENALRRIRVLPASVILLNTPAETVLPNWKPNSANLVIWSPPYFARERYGNQRTQSWKRFPTYNQWKNSFLECLVEEIHRILKPGGYFLLNASNTESHPIADDAQAIAKYHFKLEVTHHLLLGSVPYHRNGQRGGYRRECVFAFQKRRCR